MTQPRRQLYVLLIIAGWALGCAYSTKSGRVQPGLESVAVPYFTNESTEPQVEVEFTEAVIAGIISERSLRLTDQESADALVLGTIKSYRIQEVFFGQDRQAEEYEVRIACEVSLVSRTTGDVIVEPTLLRGQGAYFIDEGIEGQAVARDLAALEIVRGILNLVIEEW